MHKLIHQALLLAALTPTSLFCVDADIFKEMLTMSTSVQAQEEHYNTSIPDECVWLAAIKCRAQIRAFANAPKDQSKHSEAADCLWSTPCAQGFKKPTCLS